MSPPPSSGNVACLSWSHQGKSFGVLPWGSAFYSGEGWGRGLSSKCNHYSGDIQQRNLTTIVEETGTMYIFQPSCIYLCQVLFLWHHYDPPRRAPSPISAYQDWHTQQWQNIQCAAGGRSSSKLGHQSQRRGEPREHNQYLPLLDMLSSWIRLFKMFCSQSSSRSNTEKPGGNAHCILNIWFVFRDELPVILMSWSLLRRNAA